MNIQQIPYGVCTLLLFLILGTLSCGTTGGRADENDAQPAGARPGEHDTSTPFSSPGPGSEGEEKVVEKPLVRGAPEPERKYTAVDTMEAILAAPPAVPNGKAPTPWDSAKDPKHWDAVKKRFSVSVKEEAALRKNGFVVLEKSPYDNYAMLYHETFRSELPLYITLDSIFHAVFTSHEQILATLELERLAPKLKDALKKMHERLKSDAGFIHASLREDVDLYLTVARRLLHHDRTLSGALSAEPGEAAALVEEVHRHRGLKTIALFGRPRVVDFSQYQARGHYEKVREFTPLF